VQGFNIINPANGLPVFSIDEATGNTVCSGSLAVAGAQVFTGGQSIGGNLSVAGTSTLTGNTHIAGTLLVDGLVTPNAGVNFSTIGTPATPGVSVVLYSATGNVLSYVTPSGQVAAVSGTVQAQTSTVTVASTNAITALQSYTVPANDVAAGAVYTLEGYGLYSDTGTPTLTFTLLWGGTGGTALAAIPAITLGSGVTNVPFSYRAMVTARSTTSLWSSVTLDLGTSSTTDAVSTFTNTPTTATTVTSTGSNILTMAVTWSASSSSNTISLTGGRVARVA
jgi:hypothetical protein